jgi:hypothetical protein
MDEQATSRYLPIRFKEHEIDFLLVLEEFQHPDVKRRGVAPAIHRLIEVAMAWDKTLAGPVRAFLKANGMTPEAFAEAIETDAGTIRDILTLRTRRPDHTIVAKIRAMIGE